MPDNGQSYEAWEYHAATRLMEAMGGGESARAPVPAMVSKARAILVDETKDLELRSRDLRPLAGPSQAPRETVAKASQGHCGTVANPRPA